MDELALGPDLVVQDLSHATRLRDDLLTLHAAQGAQVEGHVL